jgi:hypothetical protein
MLEEPEDDTAKWRVKWAGSVALLRAVGHVLLYEDAPTDPELKQRMKERFSLWKEEREDNAIFWNFIVKERDSLLKHYRFGAYIEDHVGLGTMVDGTTDIHALEGDLYRPFEGDYRPGDDSRDIYEEAVNWWSKQIEAIAERLQ